MLVLYILSEKTVMCLMKGNILTCLDWSSKQVCYNKRYTWPKYPVGEDCDVSYEGKHFDLSRLVKQTGMLQ